MDDEKAKPNLKICIDNADDDIDSDVGVQSDDSYKGVVGIGISTYMEINEEFDPEEKRSIKMNTDDNRASRFKRTYENNFGGDFITGFDVSSKDMLDKREQRAKRFGIVSEESAVNELDLKNLYRSLGILENEIDKPTERGSRLNAVHVRGVDDMSTKDVFAYFQEFSPASIEWIDDSSCNVIWIDKISAARAIISKTKMFNRNMNTTNNVKPSLPINEIGKSMQNLRDENMDEDDNGSNLESDKEEKYGKINEIALIGVMDEEEETKKATGEGYRQWKPGFENPYPSVEKCLEGMPPGKWKIGPKNEKGNFLFFRFASKADKKMPGAEGRSKYYQKYGNPHYDGEIGVLSKSRKKMLLSRRNQQIREEAQSYFRHSNPITDAREAIKRRKYGDYNEDIVFESNESDFDRHLREALERHNMARKGDKIVAMPSPSPPASPEYKTSSSQQLEKPDPNRGDLLGTKGRLAGRIGPIFKNVSPGCIYRDDDSDTDIEAELDMIMHPSPPKRLMRMHADDEEERILKKRFGSPTPVINNKSLKGDARVLIKYRQKMSFKGTKHKEYEPVFINEAHDDLREQIKNRKLPKLTIHVEDDSEED